MRALRWLRRRPPAGCHRLAVNINDECAEVLRRVKDERGISTTEAIRRAIALLDYHEKQRRSDRRID